MADEKRLFTEEDGKYLADKIQENTALIGNKVDKEAGKGLSTNDYTNTDKTKLQTLALIKSIGSGLSLNTETGELTAAGDTGLADRVTALEEKLAGYIDTILAMTDGEETVNKYILTKPVPTVYPDGGFYGADGTKLVPWDTPVSINGYSSGDISSLYIFVQNSVWTEWDGPTSNMALFKVISLPDGLTGLNFAYGGGINERWFTILEELYIPESVTTIGANMFENFSKPLTVYYKGAATGWERDNITVVTN